MRALLWLFAVLPVWGADVCPAGGPEKSGGVAGAVEWRSHSTEIRKRQCVSREVRTPAGGPLDVQWPDGGFDRVALRDRVELAVCCFERTVPRTAALRFGSPERETAAQAYHEVGDDPEAEGYPDLIEEDARERSVSIRGTLWAEGKPWRVDLLLRCSASKFADQYAYQFSVTNRSEDAVEVEWELLQQARTHPPLAAQPVPKGTAYVFLSAVPPHEVKGFIQVKTGAGTVAGRFHADGFAPSGKTAR